VNCTPATPGWLRSQKRREWNWPPRKHARLQWCDIPAQQGDWSEHWLGPKGTGLYRYTEPCFYGVLVLIGPNLVPYRLRVGSGPGFTAGYDVCADDWWGESPGWTRCAL
jgi:hypothetical protein